jgi:hypothetical protein
MKYLHEIAWYLSWPLLIFISYKAVKWVLKKFEQFNTKTTVPEDNYEI